MTHRILLRGTIALIAVGALAACGSDESSDSTAAATTAAAAAPATTAAAPTTAAAAAATTAAPTTAGGGGDSPSYEFPDSLPATTMAAAGGASLALHDDPALGEILVDSEGYTMYLFTKDTGTTSVCADACAEAWPAALVTGTPTAGDGLDAAKLTASAQPDGTMQLTYNGHLLYRFAGDKAAGETNGQALNGVWFVLDAGGDQVG